MKIAIIGGSGFIGNALVNRLSSSHEVKASFFSGKRQGKELLQQTHFSFLDLSNRDSLLGFVEGQDIVINCSGTLALWNTPNEELFRTNIGGTRNVIAALQEAGNPYYIHFSTCGVSGPSNSLILNTEERKINPADTYAYTKLRGELLINDYFGKGGQGVILRPTWTYGIGDKHKLELFRSIANRKFALIDYGRARFQPVYIDDICDAVERILDIKPKGRTYLLSGPDCVTQAEAFAIIKETLQVNDFSCHRLSYASGLAFAFFLTFCSKTLKMRTPFNLTRFRLFAMNWLYNTERIRNEIGFTAQVGFQEGVSRTVDWYKKEELL